MPSVLVTGAGRGIGLAVTHRMSEAGWTVYATARSESALARLDQLHHVHAVPLKSPIERRSRHYHDTFQHGWTQWSTMPASSSADRSKASRSRTSRVNSTST
jgi:NAD(P)-dependent dehydrogenase (short-subunit alcohol dehydrogenase family)